MAIQRREGVYRREEEGCKVCPKVRITLIKRENETQVVQTGAGRGRDGGVHLNVTEREKNNNY